MKENQLSFLCFQDPGDVSKQRKHENCTEAAMDQNPGTQMEKYDASNDRVMNSGSDAT